jgi:hypothetical protein
MNGAACFQIVVGNLHFISKLFASEDKSNLINHNSFFLLQSLLDHEDSIISIEVETLFSSCQGLLHKG